MATNAPTKSKGEGVKKILALAFIAWALPLWLLAEDLEWDFVGNEVPTFSKKEAQKNADKVSEIREIRKNQAEESGFFIGLGGMLGKSFDSERTFTIGYADGYRFYGIYKPTKIDTGFEVVAGYKSVNIDTGNAWRFYLSYNARYLEALTSHYIEYLNFDYLLNIVDNPTFKFGLVFGIGTGILYEKLNEKYAKFFEDPSILAMGIHANLGARFVLHNRFAIEIIVQPKFSFIPQYLSNEYVYDANKGYVKIKVGDDKGHGDKYRVNEMYEGALIGKLRLVWTF